MESTKPTDFELLTAWRAGDLVAGDTLLNRHYAAIHRFFSNKIGRDCEDLIQATFLDCIEGIERFRAESSFRTLLFAIAWKEFCRHLRDRGGLAELAEPINPDDELLAMNDPTFGAQLDDSRNAKMLREAMRRLPEDTQVMLGLFYWESMSVQEIACVVARPVSTVKTRMRRGRIQLLEELSKFGCCVF
jgi:RNA polymerase sigma factor (sigma-70 family)